MAVGVSTALRAHGLYEDGQSIDLTDTVTWHSDDPSVAEVDTGGVIIGRNATVILAARPRTLHVLLTGDVKDRVQRAAEAAGIPLDQAARRQGREDQVRADMSRVLYGWDPHDPARYDLVINTSRIPESAVATAIVDAVETSAP